MEGEYDDEEDFLTGNAGHPQNYGTFNDRDVWQQQLPPHRPYIEPFKEQENEVEDQPVIEQQNQIVDQWERAPLNENMVLLDTNAELGDETEEYEELGDDNDEDSDEDSEEYLYLGHMFPGEEFNPNTVRSSYFQVSPWTPNMSDPRIDRVIPEWLYNHSPNSLGLPNEDFNTLVSFGYTFGRQLGFGAFGRVVECSYQTENGEALGMVCKYVVIIPQPQQHFTAEQRLEMFKNEKDALVSAKHENLIDVQNIWTNYRLFYVERPLYALFFMERADGDLWHYIDNYDNTYHTPIGEYSLREWFKQMLSGLEYLHSLSIAHRDIKPENVLYVWRSARFPYVAKLCDYGMAHIAVPDSPRSRMSTYRYGTVGYMAPEVNAANPLQEYNTFIADVYSLGVTLWWTATAQNRHELNNFHQHLEELIVGMTQQNFLQRFTLAQVRNHAWMQLPLIH